MDAEELYGLPLERFVDERTALSKALRRNGQRGEATRVSKLPKPSVAAWAVNQLVRTQRRLTNELFAAGDALKTSQRDVVAGRGDAHSLREAADRERAAVRALADAARGLLSSDGHGLSASTLARVSDTLHAAALEDSARAEVEAGCLTRELRHIGLGEIGFVGGEETGARRHGEGTTTRRQDDQADRDRKAEATRRLAEEAKRRQEATEREAAAREAFDRATARWQAAREERDRAAQLLRAAEQALERATVEAEAAKAAHQEAGRDLNRF